MLSQWKHKGLDHLILQTKKDAWVLWYASVRPISFLFTWRAQKKSGVSSLWGFNRWSRWIVYHSWFKTDWRVAHVAMHVFLSALLVWWARGPSVSDSSSIKQRTLANEMIMRHFAKLPLSWFSLSWCSEVVLFSMGVGLCFWLEHIFRLPVPELRR